MSARQPEILSALVRRYDPDVFEVGRPSARIRLAGAGPEPSDVVLDSQGSAKLVPAGRGSPDATLTADADTWAEIAQDVRGGMAAYRAGRLRIRRDLHLGVGFLAATSAASDGRLRLRQVQTTEGRISLAEAGAGPPVLLLHGLGATKVSFLPTVAALAGPYRTIAVDLPGFGDSVKPLRAPYDAAYFARTMVALLDALRLEQAHLVGNSMGGRVALEIGLRYPERVGRIGLLAPSLAWLRERPWAPLLTLVSPRLGLIQPAPRVVVESIVRRLIPGAREEWTAAGIDEFLRSYLTPRGRAAFYAAARNIYLEEPHGPDGLWTRLSGLKPKSLFVWGRKDPLVPISFERHVRDTLPAARHLELNCGHVPQLERPRETHEALDGFFAKHRRAGAGAGVGGGGGGEPGATEAEMAGPRA
ncbi:MAG: alpha/beta fold hydrolase [Actinomycetota bacterium]|nr:alpha/beta fold hydrolase [Actinomycetota bacterium]